MKNTIYAIIIAACILVAVLVFVKTRSGGSSGGGLDSISDADMVWMKCRACNGSFEMSRKQYYKDISEKAAANATAMMLTPPLPCQKCSKNAAFLAEKCANCGEIFISGTVQNDFPDRCPKCKHSKVEDSRKARQAGQG